MPAFWLTSRECAVAVVVVEDVFAAVEAGRAASHGDALVSAVGFFRSGRGLEVEVDVIADEEIEMAVLVVVEEGAAGVPAEAVLERPASLVTSVNVPLPLLRKRAF